MDKILAKIVLHLVNPRTKSCFDTNIGIGIGTDIGISVISVSVGRLYRYYIDNIGTDIGNIGISVKLLLASQVINASIYK